MRPTLQRLRAAIADDAVRSGDGAHGCRAAAQAYQVSSHETTAKAPRGYTDDHPRIELLRMKDIHAGKQLRAVRAVDAKGARPRRGGDG